jgi:hypothetical protein
MRDTIAVMGVSHSARRAPAPKRTSPVLGAITQVLTLVARLPESEEARSLRDSCLAYDHIARIWAHEAPTPKSGRT